MPAPPERDGSISAFSASEHPLRPASFSEATHILRGVGSARSSERQYLLAEPLGGDLAVAFLDLDADGAVAEILRGPERCPRSHEWIEDGKRASADHLQERPEQ